MIVLIAYCARIVGRAALTVLPAIVAVLLLAPGSVRATEATTLAGAVTGVELCPQIVCGVAVFIGRFDGALDGAPGDGRWWVLVNHEELPLPGDRAGITRGQWGMIVGELPLGGVIAGGSILNNGDGTLTVAPVLDLRAGGEGTLALFIVIDHAPFPPSVTGNVTASAGTVIAPGPAPGARAPARRRSGEATR
ncbi:MAG: hypothetical protein EXR64_00355 [Dehalococcoidia bacterium]|nr:hypothetical protein [Dehalococcoidia bacterium]